MICSCYRRDEAHDPDGFIAALAVVLGDYPASVVDYAADPRTGVITAFPMGLPNVGQISQFLEATQIKQERLQHYASLPIVPASHRLPKPPLGPGDLANVFVPNTDRNYARMVERAKTADEREYRHEQGGIRVALGWFTKPSEQARRFKPLSADDLRALYPKPETNEEAA